ncbi:MAG: M48 family metallopeptidase [Candidatus Nanoarchaeia archaeon]|nr:M48 family metallopeptidase [Candidatus Nanoarchaeia archaeon]MDD5238980.1 M48 family metallopeptidase [Candidatus Nanoarchaeia archaeon]
MAEKLSFHDEIARNNRNSIILVLVIFVFLILVGYAISWIYDPTMMWIFIGAATVISILHLLNSYFNGDKIVLMATGAKPADEAKYKFLHNTVEGLALAAGIPKPKVYIIPSQDINAFATGRDPQHSSVAVTEGLTKILNRQEMEGVIAHEMSHIGNYDIRFMMLATVMVGIVAMVGYMLTRSMLYGGHRDNDNKGGAILVLIGVLIAILAPIAVRFVQLAISRKREFLADASGAKLTRYPEGLAAALEKISKHNSRKMEIGDATASLFIANPNPSLLNKLTSTHPPIAERIRRLRAM